MRGNGFFEVAMLSPRTKVKLCLVLNVLLLGSISSVILSLASGSRYFRAGWSEDLSLIGVVIDTPGRYYILLLLIAIMNAVKVVVAELGEPVLVFNVYNPDKKNITDFTRKELLFYANIMFFVSNTRHIFEVLITVTQIDIAVFSIVFEQIVSVCTVCLLVREKTFNSQEQTHEFKMNPVTPLHET